MNKTKDIFDENGRRIPYKGMRVFNKNSLQYYKIKKPENNFSEILSNSKKYGGVNVKITEDYFKSKCLDLLKNIGSDNLLKGILNGVAIPFICCKSNNEKDMGLEFEKEVLPSVSLAFTENNPNLHFKAILQGEKKLANEIVISKRSRYQEFLNMYNSGKTIVGWYFPQALQEYDIESQREQMKTLPKQYNLVLSGMIDVSAALIGSPKLLINKDDYPPVLCLSAIKHSDKNLMLCYKAYGHHLEFWGMSQMLVPGVTQVSEQWSGGLTLFAPIPLILDKKL